jgi:stage IV sporulation protein FB
MAPMRFSLGGIPVRVDVTFWIIMGLFGLNRATAGGALDPVLVLEWVALVFVGILLHELGHAVAFRSFGRRPSVVLYGMGGLTSASGGLTPGQRLVTTLAGPGVGFLLGGLALALAAAGAWPLPNLGGRSVGELMRLSLGAGALDLTLPELVFLDLLFVNVGWGVLNLVPLHPLDGGQSLEALLQLLRVPRAEQVTAAVGIVVASAGAVVALQTGQVILLVVVVLLGLSNFRRLTARGQPAGAAAWTQPPEGAGPELQRTVAMAEQALAQGRADDAVELLRQEHRLRPSPATTRAYLAVLSRTRRLDELEELLHGAPEHLDAPTMTSGGAALVAGGRYEAALRAAETAWTADASGAWQPAVVAAAARSGLGDVDGAIRWLHAAADRGWDDRRRLESDPVFAEVRADPRLGDVLARMRV